MYKKFKIVKIDYRYCNYLRKYDNKVVYNSGSKELRPFVGVLFTINKNEYFAPLSSPKEKHKKIRNTLDLIKIDKGRLGVINFNNMIPTHKLFYREFNLNKKTNNIEELKVINLMKKQLRWLTIDKKEIYTKSRLLYNLYKNNKLPKNVKDRCCNFLLLEEKSIEYLKSKENS